MIQHPVPIIFGSAREMILQQNTVQILNELRIVRHIKGNTAGAELAHVTIGTLTARDIEPVPVQNCVRRKNDQRIRMTAGRKLCSPAIAILRLLHLFFTSVPHFFHGNGRMRYHDRSSKHIPSPLVPI